MKRLVVGISVASGAVYNVRLLQVLSTLQEIKTHLVMSPAARQILALETTYSLGEVQGLADVVHDSCNIAASISSGAFQTLGMGILPSSMKTLSGIVNSYSDGLLPRAAAIVLKEHRRLVIGVRETPLYLGLMPLTGELSVVIMSPVPAFYHRPAQLSKIIDQTVNRTLDLFDLMLPQDLFQRW